MTSTTVEFICHDHDRVRAALTPYYGSRLVLHHPPFPRSDYDALMTFADTADNGGVLQAIAWGVHPELSLHHITPTLATAALPIPDGLAHLTVLARRSAA